MSKFLTSLALSACLASFAFAQEDDGYNSYSSEEEAPSEESPAVEESAAEEDNDSYNDAAPMKSSAVDEEEENSSDDKTLYIGVHPAMALIGPLTGNPNLYVTVEYPFAKKMSIVARPYIAGLTLKYDGDEYTGSEFGLQLGARWYFKPEHRGFYIDALAIYDHASLSDDYHSATADLIEVGGMAGWKMVSGAFVFGVDTGMGIKIPVISGDEGAADALEAATSSVLFYDVNLYIGFCF